MIAGLMVVTTASVIAQTMPVGDSLQKTWWLVSDIHLSRLNGIELCESKGNVA